MPDVEDSGPAALAIAEVMVAVRRWLLPPNSWRERIARPFYVPFLARIQRRREQQRLERAARDAAAARLEEECRRRADIASVLRSARVVHKRVPMPVRLPRHPRILILKLDHLGDFILGLRAIERLRSGFPGASFTLVCGPWNEGWAEQTGWFDSIVGFDFFPSISSDWEGASAQCHAAFAALGLGQFDIAVDLRHDPDTRGLLGLVTAGFRAGFAAPAESGGAALDLALPDVELISPQAGTGTPMRAEQRLVALADAVIEACRSRGEHPVVGLVDANRLNPELRALSERRFIAIAVGTGSPLKSWATERIAELARRLVEQYDAPVALLGGPRDRVAGAAIAAALPPNRAIDLTGRVDLLAMPALLDRAWLYVGGDTGMTHLAARLGTPTVVIFSGATDFDIWCPEGPHVAVVAGQTSCSPCRLIKLEQCPYGVVCLDVIKVEDVLEACAAVDGVRRDLVTA